MDLTPPRCRFAFPIYGLDGYLSGLTAIPKPSHRPLSDLTSSSYKLTILKASKLRQDELVIDIVCCVDI